LSSELNPTDEDYARRKDELTRLTLKYDANQLALKIIANSFYGVMGATAFKYSHIPISAWIALLGRKYLSFIARLIQYFTYDQLVMEQETNPDGPMPVYNEAGEVVTREWLIERKKYLDMIVTPRLVPGLEYVTEATGYGKSLDSDIITYVDTVGIQFKCRVDPDELTNKVNDYMRRHLETDTIVMENEGRATMMTVFARKTYNLVTIKNDGLCVKHNGYERNAIAPIKQIYNYISKLIYTSNEQGMTVYPIHLLLDIYHYLRGINPYTLWTKIQLNKHKNPDTPLARYIDANTLNYLGNISTMMVLDKHDIFADKFMSRLEWTQKHTEELHLQKYIRTHFKLFYRMIYLMRVPDECRTFFNLHHGQLLSNIKAFSDAIYKIYALENYEGVVCLDDGKQLALGSMLTKMYELEKSLLKEKTSYLAEAYIDDEQNVVGHRDLMLNVYYPILLDKLPIDCNQYIF
jgi:hypothetical protein